MSRQKDPTKFALKFRSHPSGKQAAREILRLCTTANLSPQRKERISSLLSGNVDWKYLLDLATFQGMAPLISHNLSDSDLKNNVSKPHLKQLNDVYNETLYKNVIFSDELIKLLSAFRQHGIPIISLKGIALAEMLYENPALRTTSDIDVLVRPDDLPRASSLLTEMGYQQSETLSHRVHPFHEAPYFKQVPFLIHVELHWTLEDESLVSVPGEEIWDRAHTIKLQQGETLALSPEDTLLYSVVQLCKEFDRLKILSDITELVRKYHDELDWRYLVNSAGSWGIKTGAYYAFKMAQDLLEAPIPQSVIKELKPKVWRRCLVEFLLNREGFISLPKWRKLREEKLILIRGLMMKHIRQTRLVLEKYRGADKKATWLRTSLWIILVFIFAMGSNVVRIAAIKR